MVQTQLQTFASVFFSLTYLQRSSNAHVFGIGFAGHAKNVGIAQIGMIVWKFFFYIVSQNL